GVDQVMLLQQAGRYRHEDVCHTLELLGRDVIAPFRERDVEYQRRKAEELAPFIEQALTRRPEIADAEPPLIESYPLVWEKQGIGEDSVGTRRALDASPLWRLHVGQGGQQ